MLVKWHTKPYAVKRLAKHPRCFHNYKDHTCSVLRLIANSISRVKASPSDLMKALDEIDGSAVRRRLYLVQLLHQRQERESFHHKAKSTHQTRSGRRIKRSKSDGTKPRKAYERADSQTMSDLMAYHYPELAHEDKRYEERLSKLRYRLGAARNWGLAWERKASACWMYPCGMIVHLSSKTFERIPPYSMTVFWDLLSRIRGDFIDEIDESLAPTLEDYLEGNGPSRPLPFESLNLEDLRRESMDSQAFIKGMLSTLSAYTAEP